MTLAHSSYPLSGTIDLTLTVLKAEVTLIGSCDYRFERQTDTGWEMAGRCASDIQDSPPGSFSSEAQFSLPASQTDPKFSYTYTLSEGTYRFALRYYTPSGEKRILRSPEFKITK